MKIKMRIRSNIWRGFSIFVISDSTRMDVLNVPIFLSNNFHFQIENGNWLWVPKTAGLKRFRRYFEI
jgi:hypothetical protein